MTTHFASPTQSTPTSVILGLFLLIGVIVFGACCSFIYVDSRLTAFTHSGPWFFISVLGGVVFALGVGFFALVVRSGS